MATVGRRLVAALLAWCSFAAVALADDGAVAHSWAGAVQLAQADGCPAAGKTAVVFYRYVGQGEADAIRRTLEIPMTDAQGNPKDVYFTDCLYSDARVAKEFLALPRTPAYRVEFRLRGVRARCPGEVEAAFDEPGGGNECILNDESRAIEIPDPGAAITPLQ